MYPVWPPDQGDTIPCLQFFNSTMDTLLHNMHLLLGNIRNPDRQAVEELMSAQGVPGDARLAGIPWGIAVGPDHAVYIAMAPEMQLVCGGWG